MKVEMKGNDLVITIPANQNPELSKSGNSLIVASSGGNKEQTHIQVKGKNLIVGVNAYVKR